MAQAASAADCYHCGLPAPEGARYCCAGCEAVSRSIAGLGLDDYYRLREKAAPRAPQAGVDLAAFDEPLVQSRFVRREEGGERVADLILEGLTCAACAWLVEQAVLRVAGVRSMQVNFATRRARLHWRDGEVRLSRILAAIASVGYTAWPYEPGRLALVEARERQTLLRRLWIAGLGMMQVMMYAVPAYIGAEGEVAADAESLMRWAGLLLTLPVLLYSAAPFFAGAWRDLRLLRAGMDVPIALGLGAAFAASAVATFSGSGAVYFDSVTMFVFFITGSRYLELLARAHAMRSLQHLGRLVPQAATRLRGAGLQGDRVAVAALGPGDRVLVKPGETVPADGELESAGAELNEAWMSGESRPVARTHGAAVHGGAVNAGSAFVLRVTHVGADTAVSAVHRLMEKALAERPPWLERAQRAAGLFAALVVVAGIGAGLAWLAVDPDRALWIAVSVLIVTCPCALALAAPIAVTAATGAMAGRNVVVARGSAIERLADVTDVAFDKTGTLTTGALRLQQTLAFGRESADDALAIAASLAAASSHPLDRALCAAAPPAIPGAHSHRSHAGQGIEASVEGRKVRLGRAPFAGAMHGQPAPVAWIGSRDSIAWLADERGWIAAFRFREALRPEAAAALQALRRMHIEVHILSGDRRPIVEAVAAELGIAAAQAGATPEGKRHYVQSLQARGRTVAMVGDGINDAPVLAQADVSIAMGGGADLAQVRADAVLLSDSLADLASGVRLARKARRIIRQNLAWALAYNLVAIPLALAGLVTPLVASLGMAASSLAVVANALRLLPWGQIRI